MRRAAHGAILRVVGVPSRAVAALAGRPGVAVAGRVPDDGVELAAASVVVNPGRFGTGTNRKVLDAWAAAGRAISTTTGVRGFASADGEHVLRASTPGRWAARLRWVREHPEDARELGLRGWRFARTAADSRTAWPEALEGAVGADRDRCRQRGCAGHGRGRGRAKGLPLRALIRDRRGRVLAAVDEHGSTGHAPGAAESPEGGRCMPFTFTRLAIPDVILVEAMAFPDDRGYFVETYKRSEFAANGIREAFVQDNCSYSTHRVLRGLHYQKDPSAQGKLVSVTRGEIFDVAVDIRRGSPTFGQWVGERLSSANHRLLYVPAGFAHGFCTVSAEADVTYKVTSEYAPRDDRGIRWDDAAVGVRWPTREPILSPKDAALPALCDADNNFVYAA